MSFDAVSYALGMQGGKGVVVIDGREFVCEDDGEGNITYIPADSGEGE